MRMRKIGVDHNTYILVIFAAEGVGLIPIKVLFDSLYSVLDVVVVSSPIYFIHAWKKEVY